MRRSTEYTSPNQDHSSSKLSSPRSRDNNHQSSTITTTTTTSTHHQTLGDPNHSNHNPDPITAMSAPIQYRECLKNHAAASGGHVLDGCGEFMPASTEDNSPEALKCAACECHRSFHRKEIESQAKESQMMMIATPQRGNSTEAVLPTSVLLPHHRYHHHHHQLPHPHPHQPQHHHHQNSVMMAFGGAESSSEDLNAFDQGEGVLAPKKRFRTKFNNDQKEKMTEFAERIGWRIQKHDEQEVQRFCSEVGVKRQVFKVWMHNNKQAMKKKDNNNSSNNNNYDNDDNHRANT